MLLSGDPKSIQHPTGSHAVVNKWTMNNLYGVNPGECWWAASDIGWVVGHELVSNVSDPIAEVRKGCFKQVY